MYYIKSFFQRTYLPVEYNFDKKLYDIVPGMTTTQLRAIRDLEQFGSRSAYEKEVLKCVTDIRYDRLAAEDLPTCEKRIKGYANHF